jgi:hypothetical protein
MLGTKDFADVRQVEQGGLGDVAQSAPPQIWRARWVSASMAALSQRSGQVQSKSLKCLKRPICAFAQAPLQAAAGAFFFLPIEEIWHPPAAVCLLPMGQQTVEVQGLSTSL